MSALSPSRLHDAEPPTLSVSGAPTDRDIKRLVTKTRQSHIGPTALYYAGVTAPVISAGTAFVTRAMLADTGFTDYWILLISSLLAAMAGISWYLIFIRWSYRHDHGRATELDGETAIDLTPDGLHIRRGDVETRIAWRALRTVGESRRDTLITFRGADPLLVPDKWFGRDKQAAQAFRARLKEGLHDGEEKKIAGARRQ
ncbi:YcxB family protein [Henriciella marina]|uniref:YcxB family protein n=1 Tax=Henriciella marina TaxID=453851 RepID=UPI00035ED6C3|nr:YcxB family protein [Henriciella marina]